MKENLIVIRNPKDFCLNFDLSIDVDDSFKNEIEFIIKSNQS